MKGGLLLALDDGLFARSASALESIGADTFTAADGHEIQLKDADGRLFTLYELDRDQVDLDFSDAPPCVEPGVTPPDMELVTTCAFECRWPDLVARCTAAIARQSDAPLWVLDEADRLWDPSAVDPERIRL